MKKNILWAIICLFGIVLTGCEQQEDLTKFTKSNIQGCWVAVNSENQVTYYYDLQIGNKLIYAELKAGEAFYNPEDGYLYTTKDVEWEEVGNIEYKFDEKNQIIRCVSGELLGFKVEGIVTLLGSDEIFRVERKGKNEAYIYDLTDYLKDAHIYRINGIQNKEEADKHKFTMERQWEVTFQFNDKGETYDITYVFDINQKKPGYCLMANIVEKEKAYVDMLFKIIDIKYASNGTSGTMKLQEDGEDVLVVFSNLTENSVTINQFGDWLEAYGLQEWHFVLPKTPYEFVNNF